MATKEAVGAQVLSGNFDGITAALWPGVNKWFNESYKDYANEYKDHFD